MKPPDVPRRIALVDANSFYCSAEKVFRPDLANVPVVVLANNDGVIVARDAIVKSLGISTSRFPRLTSSPRSRRTWICSTPSAAVGRTTSSGGGNCSLISATGSLTTA